MLPLIVVMAIWDPGVLKHNTKNTVYVNKTALWHKMQLNVMQKHASKTDCGASVAMVTRTIAISTLLNDSQLFLLNEANIIN